MKKNTKGSFSFKGRFTLREVNGVWYVYDRDLQTITERLGNTFVKAEKLLLKYKEKHGDN